MGLRETNLHKTGDTNSQPVQQNKMLPSAALRALTRGVSGPACEEAGLREALSKPCVGQARAINFWPARKVCANTYRPAGEACANTYDRLRESTFAHSPFEYCYRYYSCYWNFGECLKLVFLLKMTRSPIRSHVGPYVMTVARMHVTPGRRH